MIFTSNPVRLVHTTTKHRLDNKHNKMNKGTTIITTTTTPWLIPFIMSMITILWFHCFIIVFVTSFQVDTSLVHRYNNNHHFHSFIHHPIHHHTNERKRIKRTKIHNVSQKTITFTQSLSMSLSSSSSSNEQQQQHEGKETITTTTASPGRDRNLDQILSKLTSGFPFFVVTAALFGLFVPTTLLWVNDGMIISIMLALVMCGTGLTLNISDFTNVIQYNWSSIPLGVLCQFLIMPLTSYFIGRTFLLPIMTQTASSVSSSSLTASTATRIMGPELFLGLILVGCSPGGTASNLVSLIANANVALSVLLTSCSTILAVVMTPLLVKFLLHRIPSTITTTTTTNGAGATATAVAAANVVTKNTTPIIGTGASAAVPTLQVSGWALCSATAQVVLVPVITGMIIKKYVPKISDTISRFTPFASVLLVSLICGGVVAQNSHLLLPTTVSSTTGAVAIGTTAASATAATYGVLRNVITSVGLLHSIGFLLGYVIPKYIFQQSTTISKTISIEVGMQNSALAVVLAKSIHANPIACLPGALSATVHSCLGSMLAAIWRLTSSSSKSKSTTTTIDEGTETSSSSTTTITGTST